MTFFIPLINLFCDFLGYILGGQAIKRGKIHPIAKADGLSFDTIVKLGRLIAKSKEFEHKINKKRNIGILLSKMLKRLK